MIRKKRDMKSYIFGKFIFPKILMIDLPGAVVGAFINKFGNKKFRTRMIFYFEDLFVNLYGKTKKILGEKETNLLWYKIGKDVSTRYFSGNSNKRIPNYLIFPTLDYVFDFLPASGFNFVDKIDKGSNENNFSVRGKNSLRIGRMGNSSLSAGVLAGILTFVYGKNIEAHLDESNENFEVFVASKNFESIYSPNKDSLKFHKNYFGKNFGSIKVDGLKKHSSMQDMVKFKKTYFHKLDNVWKFEKFSIFPSEIGVFGIVKENYFKEGFSKLFIDSYLISSESIFSNLLKGKSSKSEKLRYLSNAFSSLGFGMPSILFREEKIIVKIKNPPFSKYGPLDKAIIINGALNAAFGKKFKLNMDNLSDFLYSFD